MDQISKVKCSFWKEQFTVPLHFYSTDPEKVHMNGLNK